MTIPDEKIQEIQNRLDILDVVGEYVQLKKAGNRYIGLCPFHQEKTPSFSVNREKNLYYCFGCHKGGTIFSFIMEMEKISFPEAVKALAKKAGVELEERSLDPAAQAKASLRGSLLDLYQRVTNSYHYILLSRDEGKKAREYLYKRGIKDETITAFTLGYAPEDPEWLYRFLRKKSYSDDFLEKSGLFTRKNNRRGLFTGRIIFPITDGKGNTLAFGGRIMDKDGPKYINSPETSLYRKGHSVYGLSQALESLRKKGIFILVEGYLDVLAMHQGGLTETVAPLGTAVTKEQLLFLRRFAGSCLLVFDGDRAGYQAAVRAGGLCESLHIQSAVIELPEGKDPADIVEKEGPEALQNLMKYPINTFEYLVRKSVERYKNQGTAEKTAILGELFHYIRSADSEVRKEEYLKYLSEELGVSVAGLSRDYEEQGQNGSREGRIPLQEARNKEISVDLFLLLAATEHRQFFPFVRARLKIDDFQDPRGKELFVALEECYRQGEGSLEKLLEKIGTKELKDLILEKIAKEEFNVNVEMIIHDGVDRIKEKSLLRKREEIELTLRKSRSRGDLDEERKLIAEKVFLDKELLKYKGREA